MEAYQEIHWWRSIALLRYNWFGINYILIDMSLELFTIHR
jgi:hypothetical protein